MTVDIHSHFWPQGLLRAAHAGDEWFGWEPVRLASGILGLALGDRLVRFPVPDTDLADFDAREETRRRRSVDAEVMMHVGFLWNQHLDGEQAASHCRELNEELAAAQSDHPSVYRGLGVLPFHAPDLFGRELAALLDTGLRAVALPASVRGANLDEGHLLSMVEQLVSAGVAMLIHPTYLDPPGRLRFPRYYFVNSIGASLECTVAFMSLIHAGLFDRHEDPKIVIVQGGGSVPYEIGRFSLRYHERSDLRTMAEPPDAYLRRAYYDCMIADSDSLRFLVDRVGADRVMVGTDFPFKSDVPQGAAAWIAEHPGLEADQKSAILDGNARRVFGLPTAPDPAVDHATE
jgi:aminocarboxymuconate-semialdehyde decarboxylase